MDSFYQQVYQLVARIPKAASRLMDSLPGCWGIHAVPGRLDGQCGTVPTAFPGRGS